jgi:heme/copper-type cytochrome/quinol oxidase subunit 2
MYVLSKDAQVTPKEADPELSLEGIIGISIGAVVVVIIFVIVIVCCINYKRYVQDTSPPSNQPNKPLNAWKYFT